MKDIYCDTVVRSTVLHSCTKRPFKLPVRTFTEREGINDLVQFIRHVISVTKIVGSAEALQIRQRALDFAENFHFVGYNELDEAIRTMAGSILKEIQEGKYVYLYLGHRAKSERYITILLVETFHMMTENEQHLRDQLRICRLTSPIIKHINDNGVQGSSLILIPDDFILSGNTISGLAGQMF